MSEYNTVAASRFIGLDIHKAYFVAAGVNSRKELVFGPQRVSNAQLERWMRKHLTSQDAVVLEMTTNTYAFYDTLLPQVHSVTVVHPPHVALITRAPVKTDRKAALGLAQLHAAGSSASLPQARMPGAGCLARATCAPVSGSITSGHHTPHASTARSVYAAFIRVQNLTTKKHPTRPPPTPVPDRHTHHFTVPCFPCSSVSKISRPRERALEARFGEAYLQYKNAVPCWLGKIRR